MTWKNKRLATMVCALALAIPTLSGIAAGAEPSAVHAEIWPSRMYVDDIFVGFHNEQGRTMEAVSYQGTIYIPIRNAGEWMGCVVAWNQGAQAIHLTSGGQPVILADKDTADDTEEELLRFRDQRDNGVEFTLRPDITIYLDQKVQHFTTVNGDPVYPAVLNNVTYLPVRNVGEMCGMGVAWFPWPPERPKTVQPDGGGEIFLYTPLTEGQKAESLAYRNTVTSLMEQLDAVVGEYTAAEDMDTDMALAKLNTMQSYARQMMEAQLQVPVLKGHQSSIAAAAQALCETGAIAHDIRLLKSGKSFAYVKQESMFAANMITMRGTVSNMQRMLTALSL